MINQSNLSGSLEREGEGEVSNSQPIDQALSIYLSNAFCLRPLDAVYSISYHSRVNEVCLPPVRPSISARDSIILHTLENRSRYVCMFLLAAPIDVYVVVFVGVDVEKGSGCFAFVFFMFVEEV